eukprot:15331671-Ditylum_brightwellii.AAC.1
MCYLLRHEKIDDDHQILYCIKKYAKITHEGAPVHFFSLANHASAGNDAGLEGGPVVSINVNLDEEGIIEEQKEGTIPFEIQKTQGEDTEEIICIRSLGFDVDDDNELAPKNVPNTKDDALDSNSTATNNGLYANHKQEWELDLY